MDYRKNVYLLPLLAAALSLLLWAEPAAGQSSLIWIEGENPTRENVQANKGGWGRSHVLSEGSWLHLMVNGNEVAEKLPEEGLAIGYDFTVEQAGEYALWHRVGYEFARSDYQWRIDDGPWSTVVADRDLTTDMMAIDDWAEVAWLQLGQVRLSEGQHTVTFRVPRPAKASGDGYHRLLFATDAIVLSPEPFHPNGPHKPGDDWRTERDKAAIEHVFDLADGRTDGGRTTLNMAGDWMYARFDERGPLADRTGPIAEAPPTDQLHWQAITVPGPRNDLKPDQWGAHRFFYRAKVRVPASMADRSFVFSCDEASLITTVFVNGRRVGFSDAALAPFRFDITDAIEPGQVNEIWVGVKDAYYGVAAKPGEPKSGARYKFNTPPGRTGGQGFTLWMDFPVARYMRSGMMDAVKLTAAGPVYADDVYVIPEVADRRVRVETTLRNPGDQPRQVTVRTRMVDAETGEVATRLPGRTVRVPAGGEQTIEIADDWADAQLWWPDDPQLYHAVTELHADGEVIDTKRTRFGYRNWTIDGTRFVLNGVPWQMRANLDYNNGGSDPADAARAVAKWRQTGQNMFRLRFQDQWAGMTQNEALAFFDEQGVPVRKTVSTFDGQMGSYWAVETVEVDGEQKRIARPDLHDNWRKQVRARVKHQRNHPSIFVWELDNEIVFINNRNRGWLAETEPEFKKAAAMIAGLDRQGRGRMVAGGRALMDQSLPINGTHYEAAADRHYPDAAYGLEALWTGTSGHQPWPMALDKPIFMSEEFFAHGPKPGDFASVGGEIAFAGAAEAREGIGRLARMYSEGYRWQELAAFHYWFSGLTDAHEIVWQPVVALVREWNTTFASGATVERTVMVRNDTRHDSPITLRWAFKADGRMLAADEATLTIAPGHGQVHTIGATMPVVDGRTTGVLELACVRGGEVVWREDKPFHVINPDAAAVPDVAPGEVLVWDASGKVGPRLTERGIPFTAVDDPHRLPDDYRLLIVGPDTVTAELDTDRLWYRESLAGRRILVLDQTHPLHYHAIPADTEVTDYDGRFAFSQDMTHPIFDGLRQEDLRLWAGDHVAYRNIYRKPSAGGMSLAHADDRLDYSAIMECRTGDGLILLCQMAVGTKLDTEPVARRLFDNLLGHALTYQRIDRTAALTLDEGDLRRGLIEKTGATVEPAAGLIEAMRRSPGQVVIAEASADHLRQLLDHPQAPDAFFGAGGDLMLWNLKPEGLEAFNALVGVDHLIRPFGREKVTVRLPRHRLARGLSQRDLRMTAGRMAAHQHTEWVRDDVFTHVLMLDQIVPFLDGPGIAPDHNGGSIANGFTDKEYWRYVHYIGYPEDGRPPVYSYQLPRPQTITQLAIVPNSHYQRIREMRITFHQADGGEQVETITLAPYDRPNNPRQRFDLRAENVERFDIAFAEWDDHARNILGIDNLWIRVEKPEGYFDRVQPLLNLGTLNYYPIADGGILLNQLNIKESEADPEHARKKQAIVTALLRNLNVAFPGRRVILPGEGLRYHPLSMEGKANVFLTKQQGWPDRFWTLAGQHDLSHLPIGEQTFRGVRFEIRDFLTSPLENGIGLGKRAGLPEQVEAIEVDRKADALFFLHTLVGDKARDWLRSPGWQKKEPTPTIWRYKVHYADGEVADADVRLGLHVANMTRDDDPADLKGATVAWAAPFDEDQPRDKAVIYTMQWDNPRPDVSISHIDIELDQQRTDWWGQPLILGITAAEELE